MKNTLKKVMGTILVSALLVGVMAVPSQTAQASHKNKIWLDQKKVKLKKGESSNPKVVKITKKKNWKDIAGGNRGDIIEENAYYQFVHQMEFKAKKKGKATITATCGGKTYKAKVSVTK